MASLFKNRWIVGLVALLTLAAGLSVVHAQRRLDIYLLAFDDKGFAVTDLKATELQFQEKEVAGSVLSLEPSKLPVKVTVMVDNGIGMGAGRDGFDNIQQYRSGLKKFFSTLPPDVEVALIATAPNPRFLLKPTTDQVQIQKAADLLTPDSESYGRFTDALTEYADRIDIDFRRLTPEDRLPYSPVVVSIGSSGTDGSRIEVERVNKAIGLLQRYRVATNFVMVSNFGGSTPENEGGPVLIAKAFQDATRGQYYPLAGSAATRMQTLLPEIAQKIASRHLKQTLAYRVTLERPAEATDPMGGIGLKLNRPGVQYIVSIDGTFP